MKSLIVRLAASVLVFLMISGCGKDDKSTNPPGGNNNTTLSFVGTVNGMDGAFSGSLSLAVANDSAVTGTFKIVSPTPATHSLTGLYDDSSKVLAATGDGFNFGGLYDGINRLEGAMTGNATGMFVAVKDDNNSAAAFCGTFSGDDDGVWNFTIDGTTIAGSFTTTSGNMGALDGTISGNTITISNPLGGAALATGTRSGDNASGTWNDGQGNAGSWIGYKSN